MTNQKQDEKIACGALKGKTARLKNDFIPECEYGHFETGYWHLKKGTCVYIQDNESDGTCYIEYIEAVFKIQYSELEVE